MEKYNRYKAIFKTNYTVQSKNIDFISSFDVLLDDQRCINVQI